MAVIVEVDKQGNEYAISGTGVHPDNVSIAIISNKLAIKNLGVSVDKLAHNSVSTVFTTPKIDYWTVTSPMFCAPLSGRVYGRKVTMCRKWRGNSAHPHFMQFERLTHDAKSDRIKGNSLRRIV
ncbi:MAG: hypothetical protein LBB22_04520 [Treponema sp.]|jgi:hypothetical protein|nr:hypothetical protein [Treponema sp.]